MKAANTVWGPTSCPTVQGEHTLPTGGPGCPLGPGGPWRKRRTVRPRSKASHPPTPPRPPPETQAPWPPAYRPRSQDMTGHGQESPECPPPDSTIPPAHTPQPTHPRTLQSLEGDRSGETELEEQVEPCRPPAPHPPHCPPACPLTKSPRLPLSPFGPCRKPWPSERGLRGGAPPPGWGN